MQIDLMPVQHLFKPFDIEFFEVDECPCKPHRHTFFELVFILEGYGTYNIADSMYTYAPGDVFLVMPMRDNHTVVDKRTSFLFVRFNNVYLESGKNSADDTEALSWTRKLEFIYRNHNAMQARVFTENNDQSLLQWLALSIITEHKSQRALRNEMVQQLVNTLLTVVARNINFAPANRSSAEQKFVDIIRYIHVNIHEQEKLTALKIAGALNISVNYISEYFKKHMHQTMQQYIISYKISLIEIRLMHTNMRLGEIANEFGLTDESHLARLFKKHRGISPGQFRKQLGGKNTDIGQVVVTASAN